MHLAHELQRRREVIDAAIHQFGRLEDIITQAVTRTFEVSAESLHSHIRTDRIAIPRQAAMTLMYENGFSYQEIAEHFNREHGTIMYGVKATAARSSTDSSFAAIMQSLRTQVAAILQHRSQHA